MKNHEIEDLYSTVGILQKENSELKTHTSSISQYETKIALLSQELERVHSLLRDKSSRYDELLRDRSNIENQMRVAQSDRAKCDEDYRRR